jgi:hypothetical protein
MPNQWYVNQIKRPTQEQVWTTKILSQYLIGNDYWWLYYLTVVKQL